MRSASPSEGSEGTGDDGRRFVGARAASKPAPVKKRRSFKKRFRERDDTPLIGAASFIESDPDSANASFNRAFEDDAQLARNVDGEDVIDSNLFRSFLSNFRSEKMTSSGNAAALEAEKQRRKEEKRRAKEEVEDKQQNKTYDAVLEI